MNDRKHIRKPLPERLRGYVRESREQSELIFPLVIAYPYEEGGASCGLVEKERNIFTGWADEIEREYIPRKEAEAERQQIITAQHDSAHHIMRLYAEEVGKPMEDGENITRWLDRWFIPRPCFEDGEPVQFGDEVKNDEEYGEAVCEVSFCDDGTIILLNGTPEPICETKHGYPVERPTPKVLDADGVPCKRGDRVYSIKQKVYSDPDGYIVDHVEVDDGINSPRIYFIDDVGMSWMKASELTHEQPVFDVDGVRICKGDTVWNTTTGAPCEVISVCSPTCVVRWLDGDYLNSPLRADCITHREPDSLEKLLDDMSEYSSEHVLPGSDLEKALDGWIGRTAALVERGA